MTRPRHKGKIERMIAPVPHEACDCCGERFKPGEVVEKLSCVGESGIATEDCTHAGLCMDRTLAWYNTVEECREDARSESDKIRDCAIKKSEDEHDPITD